MCHKGDAAKTRGCVACVLSKTIRHNHIICCGQSAVSILCSTVRVYWSVSGVQRSVSALWSAVTGRCDAKLHCSLIACHTLFPPHAAGSTGSGFGAKVVFASSWSVLSKLTQKAKVRKSMTTPYLLIGAMLQGKQKIDLWLRSLKGITVISSTRFAALQRLNSIHLKVKTFACCELCVHLVMHVISSDACAAPQDANQGATRYGWNISRNTHTNWVVLQNELIWEIVLTRKQNVSFCPEGAVVLRVILECPGDHTTDSNLSLPIWPVLFAIKHSNHSNFSGVVFTWQNFNHGKMFWTPTSRQVEFNAQRPNETFAAHTRKKHRRHKKGKCFSYTEAIERNFFHTDFEKESDFHRTLLVVIYPHSHNKQAKIKSSRLIVPSWRNCTVLKLKVCKHVCCVKRSAESQENLPKRTDWAQSQAGDMISMWW